MDSRTAYVCNVCDYPIVGLSFVQDLLTPYLERATKEATYSLLVRAVYSAIS